MRGEVEELQTQLLRHQVVHNRIGSDGFQCQASSMCIDSLKQKMTSSQEEVEELTALYDSEKSQNQALEEAVAAEKENFNKVETIQICGGSFHQIGCF